LRYSCLISTVSPIILVFTCWDFALSWILQSLTFKLCFVG
jgi:hypothetical protein